MTITISIHALREEGDRAVHDRSHRASPISIHALREEGDGCIHSPVFPNCRDFNPRPPRGGRLLASTALLRLPPYFNPRPPRGGRRVTSPDARLDRSISIHALREEGDFRHSPAAGSKKISIHALREEGDGTQSYIRWLNEVFQSTPSARRATPCLPVSRPA